MKTLFTALLTLLAVTTSKALDIRNAIAEYYQRCPQEKIFIHTDKDQYMAGDTVWFRAHLVDAMTMTERSESKFVYVELYDSSMSLLQRHMVKADSLGVFANALRLSPQFPTGAYTLMAYTKWMQNFPNSRFFYKRLTIAGKDAKSIATTAADDEATYVASDGQSACDANTDIRLSQRNEYLQVQYESAAAVNPADLSLAIFGSGNIVVVDSLGEKPVTFRQQELFSGVVNVAVVNRTTGEVVAERLAYIKGAGLPDVTVRSSDEATDSSARTAKTLDISIKNILGAPLAGDFSISVTDADVVARDSTQQDIATYLLVGSELEPMFSSAEHCSAASALAPMSSSSALAPMSSSSELGSVAVTAAAAIKHDYLMSRQCDMCFRLADMLKGELPKLTYDIQRDQRISGTVQGALRKKLKTPRLMLFNPKTGSLDTYELPSNTHFNLTDMDFPDGASFIIEATRYTGSNGSLELKIDKPSFPAPYAIKAKANGQLLTDNFLKYERMHAAINGINEMNYLEELEVKGYKNTPQDAVRKFATRQSYDRDIDGATSFNDMNTWLSCMGYTRLTTKGIYVDGFHTTYDELMTIDPQSVKSIHNLPYNIGEYYVTLDVDELARSRRNMNIFSPFDSNAILYIETDRIYKRSVADNPLAIKVINPLGYMPPVSTTAFDAPHEEGMTDIRTTLYWSPYVKLSDSGEAKVVFYPSDTSKRYRVTIQGVTTTGHIISKEIEL